MVDRAHHTNKTTNAGGLDFMLNDRGIQEQMIPLVVNAKSKNNVFQLSIDNSGALVSSCFKFWSAFTHSTKTLKIGTLVEIEYGTGTTGK